MLNVLPSSPISSDDLTRHVNIHLRIARIRRERLPDQCVRRINDDDVLQIHDHKVLGHPTQVTPDQILRACPRLVLRVILPQHHRERTALHPPAVGDKRAELRRGALRADAYDDDERDEKKRDERFQQSPLQTNPHRRAS